MAAYSDLNKQFINGEWIEGKESFVMTNTNPFNNKIIHGIQAAGKSNVDEAYEAAANAAKTWAHSNPLYRRDLLLKAAIIILERKEEYIDWLTKEAGSTYIKGVVEVQQAHDVLVEASSFPTRMHGLTLNSTIDGKETYVYRNPLGVIGLIALGTGRYIYPCVP